MVGIAVGKIAMLVSDDVAVDAIMEFIYSILHGRNHINSNITVLFCIQSYTILSCVISNMSHAHTFFA